MSQAGIRDIDAAKQQVDFSKLNLDCGKQFTDIDSSTDINAIRFFFGEYKYDDAPCPEGQRRHLVALVDAIRAPRRDGSATEACAFIARHKTPRECTVDASTAVVTEYYWRFGEWKICRPSSQPVLVNVFINNIAERMKELINERVQQQARPAAPERR